MALIQSVKGKPDPLAPFEYKTSDYYGLQIANLIAKEWFNGGLIDSKCNFMSRRAFVRKMRLLVRGEQDLRETKSYLSNGGKDLDKLNINWKTVNWASKFCRILSNSITDENYVLDIRSSDKLSTKLKQEKKDEMLKNMISSPMLKKAKENFGIDLMPKGYIPESEDEIDFLFECDERPKAEIFEEVIIDYIKHSNDWDFIQQQTAKDAVDVGLFGVRCYTDKNDGVKISIVDPENYIHSHVTKNDFSDKFYEGVIDTITLSDLRRESDFSEEDLRQIAKTYSSINRTTPSFDFNRCSIDDIIDYKIDVLRFAFKTSKTIVYKQKIKNGNVVKVIKKTDQFVAPNYEDVGVVSKTLDTWFEGNFVIGANAIYGYKECENLARDTMNKAMSPFIFMVTDMYEGRPKSFLSDIEPLVEDLQNIILKIRTLRAKLKPDLITISLDQLADLGGGNKYENWKQALSLLNTDGVIIEKINDFGELGIKEGPASKPIPIQQGSAISILMNEFAFQYNLIRDVTGINPAVDGSNSAQSLVGVTEMQKLAGNNATKHIVNSVVMFNKKLCELISTRINGIFKAGEAKHIQELYINVVGKRFSDAIEVLKNRHLHEFGFTFRFLPTSEEMREFNEGLSVASSKGYLDEIVVIKAKNFARTNVKLAIQYLTYQTQKARKREQDNQLMQSKAKSENDAMAAQAKIQADTQAYQVKAQIDIQKELELSKIRLQEAQALKQINAPYDDKKFSQDAELEMLRTNAKQEIESFKENRKDDRTKIQASQQSKLIDQRTNNKMPLDFEEEDFDFDEM